MPWQASDIALIITTCTTAFTAVASLGFPLATNWWSRKAEARGAKYQRLEGAVTYCVANVDEYVSLDNRARMSAAYAAVGLSAGSLNEAEEEFLRRFESQTRLVELYASEVEVSAAGFLLQVYSVQASKLTFEIIDGNLTPGPENGKMITARVNAKATMTTEACQMLCKARAKLKV